MTVQWVPVGKLLVIRIVDPPTVSIDRGIVDPPTVSIDRGIVAGVGVRGGVG